MTDGDRAAPAATDGPGRGLSETIQRFGYSVEYVSDAKERQPSFAYTIGLFAHGYPELLVFGHRLLREPAVEPIRPGARSARVGHCLHHHLSEQQVAIFDIDDEVDIDNDLRSRSHLGPGRGQAAHPVQHLTSGLGPNRDSRLRRCCLAGAWQGLLRRGVDSDGPRS